jgi:hypothetical protein
VVCVFSLVEARAVSMADQDKSDTDHKTSGWSDEDQWGRGEPVPIGKHLPLRRNA